MNRERKWFIRCWALGLPLLLFSCGTKKAILSDTGKTVAVAENKDVPSLAVRKLSFVQKVSDNRVYAQNITGSLTFSLQAGSKDVTLPGALRMRKDQVIRLQLFVPLIGSEVGRIEFTPEHVLIIDRIHKEYVKADYRQVSFLQKQGITFYSLQALFWNQLLLPGKGEVTETDLKQFDVNLDATGQDLPVTIQNGKMLYQWMADRNSGRIRKVQVSYTGSPHQVSSLNLLYDDFRNVGVKSFPASLHFLLTTQATKSPQTVKMNLDLNEVTTDGNWDSETQVSSKYKQVSPDEVLDKIMKM